MMLAFLRQACLLLLAVVCLELGAYQSLSPAIAFAGEQSITPSEMHSGSIIRATFAEIGSRSEHRYLVGNNGGGADKALIASSLDLRHSLPQAAHALSPSEQRRVPEIAFFRRARAPPSFA